jgi:outer membrane cobalamin receptor
MKASTILTRASAATLLLAILAGTTALAHDPREREGSDHYAYVVVTGSNIPQRVKIKSIGTLTDSPLRVFKRREIDQTGAFNTEDVLRHDPSIQVHGFGSAGPGN